jgi:hypothetical protein
MIQHSPVSVLHDEITVINVRALCNMETVLKKISNSKEAYEGIQYVSYGNMLSIENLGTELSVKI